MKKHLLFALLFGVIHLGFSQDFYLGAGATFVSSSFDFSAVNKDLAAYGIENIKDTQYNTFGISAKARGKISEKIGVNLGCAYVSSSNKIVPLKGSVNIPPFGNQTITFNTDTKLAAYNANLDVTYSIINNKLLDFFVLCGVDYSLGKIKVDYPSDVKNLGYDLSKYENFEDSVVGVNAGFSAVTTLGIFAELKAKTNLQQYQATLGYLYKF